MAHLEKLLKKHSSDKPTLIVTDGVFSMDGDLAPLPSIYDLAQKYNAQIYVDDAHGTGVLGQHGRGTVEHFDLEEKIEFQMATLGKALGTFGGFFTCQSDTRTYLLQKAKSLIFTTALPPFILAASTVAIDWIQNHPELREKLWKNREYFMGGLRSLGFHLTESETPIIPILIGPPGLALTFSQRLLDKGIFAPAIRPPTVPKGTSRIRTTIMATHTLEQMDFVLDSFQSIGKAIGIIK
jgi:glycine C-acetyltransferase/8-amino-7-oxononanoate synthase